MPCIHLQGSEQSPLTHQILKGHYPAINSTQNVRAHPIHGDVGKSFQVGTRAKTLIHCTPQECMTT